MDNQDRDAPPEIALVGDLTDHEAEITEKLLDVAPGGECTLYFDSPGGSPYCATGIVTGECSSATLWPFAVCTRRIVTPFSVFLFHPMKWQSEEHVGLAEAAEWSRHFSELEKGMDSLLAELLGISLTVIDEWITPGRYITGTQMAEAGLAELVDLNMLSAFSQNGAPARRKRAKLAT